ncbi:MAG: hypothetical protein BWY44_00940 [Candidatus Omnitrophica bacterium ADurb.Bin292]|nr:MAG: hypothetical protein BWY44_00940 [Candidatus Omnitrophica bacterium ADurb.Bin292]
MTGFKGKALRFIVSVLAICLVVYSVRGKITDSLSILRDETQWAWFVAALVAYLVALGVIAVRMQWVFNVQDVRLNFKECYYLGFVGMFYNLFLPSSVGGDIARAFYAYKQSGKKIESATSVLLDRLMGFVAIIIIAFIGLIMSRADSQSAYVDYCVYGALGVLLFCIAFFSSRRFAGLFKGFSIFAPGQKWKERVAEVYNAIYGYRHHQKSVLGAIFLSFIGQSIFILSYFLIAQSLGGGIPFWKFFILIPVVTIVSMAPSIGGLGVREASTLYLFSRYLSPERALAYTLLVDMLIYSFSIGSGVLYAFRGGLKRKGMREMEMMRPERITEGNDPEGQI